MAHLNWQKYRLAVGFFLRKRRVTLVLRYQDPNMLLRRWGLLLFLTGLRDSQKADFFSLGFVPPVCRRMFRQMHVAARGQHWVSIISWVSFTLFMSQGFSLGWGLMYRLSLFTKLQELVCLDLSSPGIVRSVCIIPRCFAFLYTGSGCWTQLLLLARQAFYLLNYHFSTILP